LLEGLSYFESNLKLAVSRVEDATKLYWKEGDKVEAAIINVIVKHRT